MSSFRMPWLFPLIVAVCIISSASAATLDAGKISGRLGVYQWAWASSMAELTWHSIELIKLLDKEAKAGQPQVCIIKFCTCSKDSETILYLKHFQGVSERADERELDQDMEARLLSLCAGQEDCGGCEEGSIRSITLMGPPDAE